MRLEWTEPALADLEAIRDYIALDSPANAAAFIERLLVAVERLLDFPRLGRPLPEAKDLPEEVRDLIVDDYRILYWVLPEHVRVLAVIHGAMSLPDMPKKPWE